MIDYMGKVLEFHNKHKAFTRTDPGLVPYEVANLRIKLMTEELIEFIQADSQERIIEVADALADLLYVVFGTALAYGIPMDAVFSEVHASNMSKDAVPASGEGRPVGIGTKVQKGPNFRPPDIESILEEYTACR